MAWSEPLVIDTYFPKAPDRMPAYLDKRVYQGSSGRVFPLPFHERVSDAKVPHAWEAVHLENQWLRLVILPELGGRLHIAWDKTANYDLFYRNNVIKPALVGLTGPWIAGGVEFNWPQHHRPATFLPVDIEIEREADGSVTVWCSDHDPFARMKGMHGIRLRPDSSAIEARVRLYNRSETRQPFLWWANVAAAVNDDYQSFFPLDVEYVADHARRAITSYPQARSAYYGVDYPLRAATIGSGADRLDWYKNIPVPTSYMVLSTEYEFFGGYDHGRNAGFVHWAPGAVAPGKKQWTWGNAPFGHVWDSHLSDGDGPYVELMAGVFTDNQPDFAYLAAGETKTFSQFWYPIAGLGPAHQANRELALRLDTSNHAIRVSAVASEPLAGVTFRLESASGSLLDERMINLAPAELAAWQINNSEKLMPHEVVLTVTQSHRASMSLRHPQPENEGPVPLAASEPPLPAAVGSIDELIHIATYLDQYRHATRSSEPYWHEAQRRDPQESRAAAALGAIAYARGLYEEAVELLSVSVARETTWSPTPASGAGLYRLGLALIRSGDLVGARAALERASWDSAFFAAARYALARVQARAGEWEQAKELLRPVVITAPDHLQARDLFALLLTTTGDANSAKNLLSGTLALDPLDQWARHQSGLPSTTDPTIMLDVALEYAGSGFHDHALDTLTCAEELLPDTALGQVNVGPLIGYHRAKILRDMGRFDEARDASRQASLTFADFCLPSRLDDIDALFSSIQILPNDPLAWALIGHWYYDRARHADAIDAWRAALERDPGPNLASVLHRNLGIAANNVLRDGALARKHYESAVNCCPDDTKLRQEYDQLRERLGDEPDERLAFLLERPLDRDDTVVTVASLLVTVGRAADARQLMDGHRFQPWEGGEGKVLEVWDRANLALANAALQAGNGIEATRWLDESFNPPSTLGEARHLLANRAELELSAGDAAAARGDQTTARAFWQSAAEARGDFERMTTVKFSRQTVFSIAAMRRLGNTEEADALTREVRQWLKEYAAQPAGINFFATSLPRMLLFTDDPAVARDEEVRDIYAQLA